MAGFKYMILSSAKPGQREEYLRWYRDQHLADVRRVAGVVSAELYEVGFRKTYDLEIPDYCLMTMYELECDDPAAKIAEIKAMSGSAEMPSTDAIEKSGMLQAVGTLIRRID